MTKLQRDLIITIGAIAAGLGFPYSFTKGWFDIEWWTLPVFVLGIGLSLIGYALRKE